MTTKPTATLKKIYSLEHPNGLPLLKKKVRPTMAFYKDDQEKKMIEAATGLKKIYYKYFSSTGCKLFVDLSVNLYSIADAMFLSANTSTGIDKMVLVEFKKRYDTSYKFFTAMLEKDKYDNLMKAGELLNSKVLYVNQWDDGIITVWQLSPDADSYKWESQLCQPSDGSLKKIDKQITYLLFEKCDFIISMKTWSKIEWPALENYFKSKREN